MAKLYFEHGPMGSKKTADLLIAAYDFEEKGSDVLITKPSKDTKGDMQVVSRAIKGREVDFLVTPRTDIERRVVKIRRARASRAIGVLLVDEAQFLRPTQVDQLVRLAVVHDLPVMTFGLRTDFRTRLFPGSARLMAVAHDIRETRTMCGFGDGCKERAQFNARLVDGEYVVEGDQVAIDGENNVTYNSLCATHYIEKVGPIRAASSK